MMLVSKPTKTDKQKEAIKLLADPLKKYLMLYGGSRSGKTLILCYALFVRAAKIKSRHLICRLKFNHAKTSIWMDTLPKVHKLFFPDLPIHDDKSNYVYNFPNGSEIWVAGLDNAERTEKILGKEYSTIYFNESSQIPYTSISIALTRLAEQNDLVNKAYYDENPPTKRHWSYAQFILGNNPDTWMPLNNFEKYGSLLMNPQDNLDNIDGDYITDILDELPDKDKARFKDGLFTEDDNGSVYYSFSREKNVKPVKYDKKKPVWVGMDFNRNPMTGVIAHLDESGIKQFDELYIMGSDSDEAGEELRRRYGKCIIVPDSTGKRKQTSSAGKSDFVILESYGHKVKTTRNPFRVDRYNAVNGLFQKECYDIDPSCKNTIKDYEMLAYKEGTNLPDTTDSTIGHISDGGGYLVWFNFPIIKPSMAPRSF